MFVIKIIIAVHPANSHGCEIVVSVCNANENTSARMPLKNVCIPFNKNGEISYVLTIFCIRTQLYENATIEVKRAISGSEKHKNEPNAFSEAEDVTTSGIILKKPIERPKIFVHEPFSIPIIHAIV